MDKKLTDLVESIEDRLLEQIEEQEISQELKERIKVKALDIEIKKVIPFKKKLNKRILLVAAIMTLLSIAIGAASSNKTLQQFFSQNLSIILPSTQDIAKDISKNGITMTIDTAFGGNSSGIIVIHFTRDNGLAFEEDTQPKDLKVNVKDAMGSRGYSSSWEIEGVEIPLK